MTVTVDLLCIGYGAGPLAAAVVAARARMSVAYIETLFEPPPHDDAARASPWPDALGERWGVETHAPEMSSYIDELTHDLRAPAASAPSMGLAFTEPAPSTSEYRGPDGSVARFDGSQLRTWAYQCLDSSTGVVSTRVAQPGATRVRSAAGEVLEFSDVAAAPRNGIGEAEMHDWLLGLARESGVQLNAGVGVRRLLFENGLPSGAVVETPTGKRVVWAVHGVVLGTGSRRAGTAIPSPHQALPVDWRLCLCSRPASRFARLELVRDTEPSTTVLSAPADLNRATKTTNVAEQRRERVDAVGIRRDRLRGWHVSRRTAHW